MSELEIPASRRFYWSVRRELWENQSIYLAPFGVAALVLVGYGISMFTLPARIRAASALNALELRRAIEQPYLVAALVLMAVDLPVSAIRDQIAATKLRMPVTLFSRIGPSSISSSKKAESAWRPQG